MSALKDRLRSDLTASMKARDALRSSTLRMVLTAVTNAEVAGKEARELTDDDVLTVPWLGSAMIRACFSEQDIKQRAGACHDEYGFSAKLGLETAAEGMPVLRYQTVATRFPAGVSRFEDSLAKGPLKKKDLRTEQDTACSYTRLFRFAEGMFHPDQALPDCAGYTEP